MAKPRRYDVYDRSGKIIISGATAKSIAEQLGTTSQNVQVQFVSGNKLLGEYSVFLEGQAGDIKYTEAELVSKFGAKSLAEWRMMNKRYGKGGAS